MPTEFAWPNGNRIAVMVTLLFENWTDGQAPNYSPMTTSLKPGTYDRAGVTWQQYGGNAGIWRLMRTLDPSGIKATICANARSIELYPEAAKTAVAQGHELAAHNYTQDGLLAYMSPKEQLETIRRCVKIFEKVAKVDRAAVARDKRLQEDLGIDSLSLIDLAVATEDAFAVGIPDEELERFQTVGDIVDHIRRCRVAA